MSDKEKKKETKKRIYRIVIITIVFLLAGASIFTWLPFIEKIPKAVVIVVACVFGLGYIATIILTEISYIKHKNK